MKVIHYLRLRGLHGEFQMMKTHFHSLFGQKDRADNSVATKPYLKGQIKYKPTLINSCYIFELLTNSKDSLQVVLFEADNVIYHSLDYISTNLPCFPLCSTASI